MAASTAADRPHDTAPASMVALGRITSGDRPKYFYASSSILRDVSNLTPLGFPPFFDRNGLSDGQNRQGATIWLEKSWLETPRSFGRAPRARGKQPGSPRHSD